MVHVCDTFVRAFDDGWVFAKNSDRDPNEAQALEWHPARTWEPGSTLRCTFLEIPQAARTHAVVISRPFWCWGAEMGTNEHGVTIGNEAVFTKAMTAEPRLLGMDLVRLGLERASSAEQAVEVMIGLLETYGQGGPASHFHPSFHYDNSFLVADPHEAFVLETAGRQWALEKVAGQVRSISNCLTIPGFADKHADRLREAVARASARRACTARLAAMARDLTGILGALRCHEGPAPRYSPVSGALGGPCAHAGGLLVATQTASSWVADLRRKPPLVYTTGTAAPCLSVFKPVSVTSPVDIGPLPGASYDGESLWWRHEVLRRMAERDFLAAHARFAPARDRLEREFLSGDAISSAHAFEAAGRLEGAMTRELARIGLRETRPAWLRRLVAKWDHQAGIDWRSVVRGLLDGGEEAA
jgi:secernin